MADQPEPSANFFTRFLGVFVYSRRAMGLVWTTSRGLTISLAAKGIPTFFMYLVHVSEVLAPVLIILGIFTRLSAASIVGTMLVVLYVAPFPLMAMGEHGEWAIEIQMFYLFIPLALFFIGPGRFSVRPNKSGNWLLD